MEQERERPNETNGRATNRNKPEERHKSQQNQRGRVDTENKQDERETDRQTQQKQNKNISTLKKKQSKTPTF